MQREVTSAETLLGADVTNGISPVGEVRELVPSPDGSRVQGGANAFTDIRGVDEIVQEYDSALL